MERSEKLKLKALADIASIDITLGFDDILQNILKITCKTMGAYSGTLMLIDEATGELSIVASHGLGQDYLENMHEATKKAGMLLTYRPSGTMLRAGKHYIISNVSRESQDEPWVHLSKELGFSSIIFTPMKRGLKIIGLLNIYMAEPHQFTAEEINFATIAASQAAFMVHNARTSKILENKINEFGESRQKLSQQTCLSVLGAEVGFALNQDDTLEENMQNEREVIVHTTKTPIKDESGNTKDLQGIFWDITERKRAEERAFRESEEKYRVLFDAAPMGIGIADLGGNIFESNLSMQEMTGYTLEELKSIDVSSTYVNPNERKFLLKTLQEKGRVRDWEIRLKRKDETIYYALLNVDLLELQGHKVLLTTARDITERKRAEKEVRTALVQLREEKAKTEAIIAAIGDGISIQDTDFKILYQNRIVKDWVGNHTGEYCYRAYEQRDHICDGCPVAMSFKDGKVHTEERSTSIENKTSYFEITASPLRDSTGKIIAGIEISRDITERKRAEELHLENMRLEYASKAKSEFLANMSHELRTPLNAIIGFSELMKRGIGGQLNEKQESYVVDILNAGKHLLGLINDILDLSKVEAGRIELIIERFSVPETINETLVLIREKAAKNNVLIKKEFDPQLEFIEADKQRIKQVLFNLLSNAVKFNRIGGTITITAKNEGDMAKISVSDTGIGIREEDIGKLFNEFVQLDSGLNRKYGGTGLGLAITKKLIELHGGKIMVKSKYGEGSDFTFLLPLKRKGDNIGC